MFISLAHRHFLKKNGNEKGRFSTEILKAYGKPAVLSLLQQAVMATGTLFLQNLVNMAGEKAINGYTVAMNLNNFLIIPVIFFTTAYETFASQCFGADMRKRAREGYQELLKQGIMTCLTVLCAGFLVELYLPDTSSESCFFARSCLLYYSVLLMKYGSDAVFRADLKVSVFTVSSFVSLLVRISLAFATTAGNLAAYGCLLVMKQRNGYLTSVLENDHENVSL